METNDASLPKMRIMDSTTLKHEIMKLDYLRDKQETMLKRNVMEFYYSIKVSTLIRNTVNELNEDTETKQSLVAHGIELGSNLLLDKIMFKKGTGIKTYLLNAGLKKLVSYFIRRKRETNREKAAI